MPSLAFEDTNVFIQTVQARLHRHARGRGHLADAVNDPGRISAVLFLLGNAACGCGKTASPCVVFNKRSALVRQAGDLCCPGGGLSLKLDGTVARLLTLPHVALSRWTYWPWWRKHAPNEAQNLALFYAAAMREGVEEMRLNPFGLTFLGPLPPQHLVMFKRVIFPQAAWIKQQTRFFPNWEVERIVYIPLTDLLNPANYARYQLKMSFNNTPAPRQDRAYSEFLCYAHHHGKGTDILWGATLRITIDFLKTIFGFNPPDPTRLPVVKGRIDDAYLNPNGSN